MLSGIEKIDPTVAELIRGEKQRQDGSIRMIPSENYVSHAVMQATGSCLTNKYAEGYPGKRYYGGCECVDTAEQLAIDRRGGSAQQEEQETRDNGAGHQEPVAGKRRPIGTRGAFRAGILRCDCSTLHR